MLIQLRVDNKSSGTHRLRGPERRCERSEADENTVVNQNIERWSVSTPGHSRFWRRRRWLFVAKSGCTALTSACRGAAWWKSVWEAICSLLEPEGEARQWMQVHTRLAVASDLSFSLSRSLSLSV